MSSTVSFTVAVFYETGRLKASLQCQTFLGSIIWWNYWDGDLVKRLVTRWRADGARVWSRDCYLVHHNPLLQFLLLLLLFLPPWQIGAVDKLELSTSALRQQQAATPLRCDQIRTDQNRSEQMWPDQAHARPRRPKYRLLENNSTRPAHEMKPKTLKTHLPAPAHQSSLCFDWMCFLLDLSYIFWCSYFGTDCIMQC